MNSNVEQSFEIYKKCVEETNCFEECIDIDALRKYEKQFGLHIDSKKWFHLKTGTIYAFDDITKEFLGKRIDRIDIEKVAKTRNEFGINEIIIEDRHFKEYRTLAEAIRYKYLVSSAPLEEKNKILNMGEFIKKETFWLDNIFKKEFIAEEIVSEYIKLYDLRAKHYDTLARPAKASKKEIARNEISTAIKLNKYIIRDVKFPNFEISFRDYKSCH